MTFATQTPPGPSEYQAMVARESALIDTRYSGRFRLPCRPLGEPGHERLVPYRPRSF
jgi:hypothetical protein